MTAETHPDPFHDAIGHGLQFAVQVTSSVVTGAQVYTYLRRTQELANTQRDERARRALNAQIRADREAARAEWAPALSPDWLRNADLIQTAKAWGAAMPYADRAVPWYEPAAATVLRKTEERLRDLHPYAMAYYDRLRDDGIEPAGAMRQAAPLFARPPRARDAPYTPRPVLAAGSGEIVSWTATEPVLVSGNANSQALTEAQKQRGQQIVAALQARAQAQGRGPLGEAEQRTVLETITNLPTDVIDQVVRPSKAAGASPARNISVSDPTSARPGPNSRPWEHDFPVPIRDAVATTAQPPSERPAAASTRPQRRARGGRHRR